MKTWVHAVASLILAAILYPIFGWKVLFVFAGGVFIDIDHYLWHIYKYRDFNIPNCYRFHMKNISKNDFRNVEGILLAFHTIEFLLIAVVLSFYIEIVLISTIGLLLHYLLDLVWLYFVRGQFVSNHSIIHWIINSKSLNN